MGVVYTFFLICLSWNLFELRGGGVYNKFGGLILSEKISKLGGLNKWMRLAKNGKNRSWPPKLLGKGEYIFTRKTFMTYCSLFHLIKKRWTSCLPSKSKTPMLPEKKATPNYFVDSPSIQPRNSKSKVRWYFID